MEEQKEDRTVAPVPPPADLSRSVQRRVAAINGEPAPVFDRPVAPAETPALAPGQRECIATGIDLLNASGPAGQQSARYIAALPAIVDAQAAELADAREQIKELKAINGEGVDARELVKDLCDAREQIAAMRGVVDKLPKTADGVPIVPGTTVYRISQSGSLNAHLIGRIGNGVGFDLEPFLQQTIGLLYSTESAALAASTEGAAATQATPETHAPDTEEQP